MIVGLVVAAFGLRLVDIIYFLDTFLSSVWGLGI